MKLFASLIVAALFVSATVMADTATTSHMTGHLATRDTFGAWSSVRVDVPSGTTIVDVSAAANGRNTLLDCVFTEPTGTKQVQKNTTDCRVVVRDGNDHGLALPSHLMLDLTNENNGPVDYDITIQNTK